MTEEKIQSTEDALAIKEIAKLAKESKMSIEFDFVAHGIKEEDIFAAMATNVYQQLDSLPEKQRAAVAMASMTKMLVENFCLGTVLNGLTNEQQS
jgi:hypothetical protein